MAGEADIWQPRTIMEAQANTQSVQQRFTATAGQTFFTLTDFAYALNTGALEIYKNGLRLTRGVDFVEQTATTFTLIVPCTAGDTILAVGFVGITGAPTVLTTDIYVDNLQALRDYTGTEDTIYVKDHTFPNTSGGGFFEKLTGAAPGTYTDDNGVTIVPTGGDGSACWRRKLDGYVTPQMFGAKADGVTPDTLAFQAAVTCAVKNGFELFCPAGTYIINSYTDGVIYLNKGIDADGKGLTLRGAGRGKTIFKEGDGETALGGRYTKMFYCWLDDPVSNAYLYGSFSFSDFTIDKNARSNGTPPTLYEWEGAHMVAFQGNAGTTSIDAITFERIELIDKIGAGIVAGPSDVDCRSLTISDVQSTYHPTVDAGTVGQKGCIEIAIDTENATLESINVKYSQIEPTYAPSADRVSRYKVSNSKIDVFEYTASNVGTVGYSNVYIDIVNLYSPIKFLTRGTNTQITNSRIKLTTEIYDFWFNASNVTFLLPYDVATFAVLPVYFNRPSAWVVSPEAQLDNCHFLIDSLSVDPATTGYALRSNVTASGTYENSVKVTLDNCTFDPRLFGVVDAYSTSGVWVFNNCKMAGHTYAVFAGSFSSYYSSLTLNDCDFSAVTGSNYALRATVDNFVFKITGNYRESDWYANHIVIAYLNNFIELPTLYGNAAPTTGNYIPGYKVINSEPTAGSPEGWVCVSTGAPGTWVPFGQVGYRSDAGDPTGSITPNFVGEEYLRTGVGWYKATGATNADWQAL